MSPALRFSLREGDVLIATAEGEARDYVYSKGTVGYLCQPPEDTLHICFGTLRLEFSYFSLSKWEILQKAPARVNRRLKGKQ